MHVVEAGYLLKDVSANGLVKAIRTATRGLISDATEESGIEAELDVVGETSRLASEEELALFFALPKRP